MGPIEIIQGLAVIATSKSQSAQVAQSVGLTGQSVGLLEML